MEENIGEEKQVKKRGRPRKQTEDSNNIEKATKKTVAKKTATKKTTAKETTTKKDKKIISENKKETTDELLQKMINEIDKEVAENERLSKLQETELEELDDGENIEENKKETKKENKKEQEKKESKKATKKQEKNDNIKENKQEKEIEKQLVLSNKTEISIDNEKLEKIEKERKKQKSIPEEKKKKINKLIFKNVLIAIVIVIYFIFINLGYYKLEKAKYIIDLKVFSIITIGITIVLFERAYKKDDGLMALNGVEILFLSIVTLFMEYIYNINNEKYPYIINLISMIFGIYYLGKSIIIYIKMRRQSLKIKSDIRKIAK